MNPGTRTKESAYQLIIMTIVLGGRKKGRVMIDREREDIERKKHSAFPKSERERQTPEPIYYWNI